MDWNILWTGVQQVGFPVVLVLYLLYIIQTDLKQLNDSITELLTYVKAKMGG